MSTRKIGVEVPSTLTSATLRQLADLVGDDDLRKLYAAAARGVERCEYHDGFELQWQRLRATEDLPARRHWTGRVDVFWRDRYPVDELLELVEKLHADTGERVAFDVFHRVALKATRARRPSTAASTIRAVEDQT